MGASNQYLGQFVDNGGIHRRIDIMFTKPYEYPFAILYFTGSKDHNLCGYDSENLNSGESCTKINNRR